MFGRARTYLALAALTAIALLVQPTGPACRHCPHRKARSN